MTHQKTFAEEGRCEGVFEAPQGPGRQRQRQERHRGVQGHRDHHQCHQQAHSKHPRKKYSM